MTAALSSQLPEGHGAGSRHIQRIYPMGHGNFYGVITVGDGALRQSVSLSAQHNGKLFLPCQRLVVYGNAVIGQRHGCRSEAAVMEHGLPVLL